MRVVTLGIDIGLVNLSFCVLAKDDDIYVPLCWKNIDLMQLAGLGHVSCRDVTPMDLHDIASFVIPSLFGLDFLRLHNIQHVAIEQQPHGKYSNIKMIVISHLIYSYFRHLIIAPIRTVSALVTVTMMSAAKKYDPLVLKLYNLSKQKIYKDRKRLSVQLTERICSDIGVCTTGVFDAHKCDDLADSFLLAHACMKSMS